MGGKLAWSAALTANIGIILVAVAVSTNHWAGRSTENISAHEGLWKKCFTNIKKDYTLCRDMAEGGHFYLPLNYKSIIGLLFAAFTLHLAGIILSIIVCFMEKEKVRKVLAVIQGLVLLCSVVGLSVYTRTYDRSYYNLGWSYVVGWCGVCFELAALVFTIIECERKRQEPPYFA